VNILADVVRNARLTDEDVAAAKKDVEAARLQSEELIDEVVTDNLHVCAYDATETGGLGNSINGTQDGIAAVNAETLKGLRKALYCGPRMVLVGAGAVNHKELEALAQQYLGDLDAKDSAPVIDTRYVGGDIRLSNHKIGLAHQMWAVETTGASSGDMTVLQLATQIHGNWHRSQHELANHSFQRLIKNFSSLDFGANAGFPLSEKAPELTTTFLHQYEDTGLFGGYVVGRNLNQTKGLNRMAAEALEIAISDYGRLAKKGIDQTEFEQAKVNLKAQLLFNTDGATNTAKELGHQTIYYGRRMPLEEAYARIDDVTASNLQEVLQHYFLDRKPVFSIYGDTTQNFQYSTMCFYFTKLLH
jgi:predicted Zn-dependent peptidase